MITPLSNKSFLANVLVLAFGAATLICKPVALAETLKPEIRFRPAAVKPGEAVKISVVGAKESRFYLQSDDLENLPLNTIHDDRDGALVLQSPGWTSHGPNEHTKVFHGDTFLNSPEAGASLEIPFTGEFFRIFGFKAPNRGIVEVYLDGQLLEAVDTYAAKEQPGGLLYEKYGLPNGPHVVRLVVSGRKSEQSEGTAVSFDAMESGVGVTELEVHPKREGLFEIRARSVVGIEETSRVLPVGGGQSGAGVEFSSENPMLQRVFDAVTLANLKNEERMPDGRRVLVEGDIWRGGLWLETQPMGGTMYGKFDLEIARNNMEVVIDGQLENGKLPSLSLLDGNLWNGSIGFNSVAQYGLDLYYLLNKDSAFLDKLENALTRYDEYLWAHRDRRNQNGLLEAYGTTDTGEDGQDNNRVPLSRDPDGRFVDSVSVTADSYANRAVLAKIAEIKGDESKRQKWQALADELQQRAKKAFWVPERKAAFDLDPSGEILPALNQLNIRTMTQGMFTQEMAEDFVRSHLMNPEEFFTPYPIPSTAINDPTFHNVEDASEYATWSGPSMGLTLQRSVKALENYGFYVEIGKIGERLLNRIGREPVKFPVQFNPLTGEAVARHRTVWADGPGDNGVPFQDVRSVCSPRCDRVERIPGERPRIQADLARQGVSSCEPGRKSQRVCQRSKDVRRSRRFAGGDRLRRKCKKDRRDRARKCGRDSSSRKDEGA
jgi:hypothetical protein